MKQAKVLSRRELKRLLAVISQERYSARNRIIVMMSFYGGLRVGEIATLLIGDVFTDDGTVKDQILLLAKNTKTNEARRIFINTKFKKELQTYGNSLKKPLTPDSPLIKSQKGKSFSANSLCQLFMRLYKLAGINGASSHSGRRTFITKLATSGISAKVIMTLAGHKNLSTTQVYIDVNDTMLKEAVEIL